MIDDMSMRVAAAAAVGAAIGEAMRGEFTLLGSTIVGLVAGVAAFFLTITLLAVVDASITALICIGALQ
jgi:hypothetical protein